MTIGVHFHCDPEARLFFRFRLETSNVASTFSNTCSGPCTFSNMCLHIFQRVPAYFPTCAAESEQQGAEGAGAEAEAEAGPAAEGAEGEGASGRDSEEDIAGKEAEASEVQGTGSTEAQETQGSVEAGSAGGQEGAKDEMVEDSALTLQALYGIDEKMEQG